MIEIEEAILLTQETFGTVDKDKIENLVRACYGQPYHIIDCFTYAALKDEPYAFPVREDYRFGMWNGYLLALVGERPKLSNVKFNFIEDIGLVLNIDRVNETWSAHQKQITSYERCISELKSELDALKSKAQCNGLRLSGDQWVIPAMRVYLCGGNTICLVDHCDKGTELLEPSGYTNNGRDPTWYFKFPDGSEKSIQGNIQIKHGCDHKDDKPPRSYHSFLHQLKDVMQWTVKKDQISDPSKPRAIITVREFHCDPNWIKFYWQYESSGGNSTIHEQITSFHGFMEKFEPFAEQSQKTFVSLVEEAHAENLKLFYCKEWNAVYRAKACPDCKEIIDIKFSEPYDKNSWYDFRGYGYMQPEPIVLTFADGTKKELGNIDGFVDKYD